MQSAVDLEIAWVAIGIIALGTYAFRLSFFEVFHQVDEVPDWLEQALTFIPVAIISAILVPRLMFVDGTLLLSVNNENLMAGVVAAIAAWKTENIAVTIVVGMAVLWILTSIT